MYIIWLFSLAFGDIHSSIIHLNNYIICKKHYSSRFIFSKRWVKQSPYQSFPDSPPHHYSSLMR